MGTGPAEPPGAPGGDCGATSPQGRVTSSHGRKVLTKANQAGCGSAAGRESESPGLFCCQVISGSIKRCLRDAKSISSPIWMPSTPSHFLPNRYQPRSSLPNIALYSLPQLYKYFLQQVKKKKKKALSTPPPTPRPKPPPSGCLLQLACRCRKTSLGANITLHSEFSPWLCRQPGGCWKPRRYPGTGTQVAPGLDRTPPWVLGKSPGQGVPYLPAERSLPCEGFCA